LLWVSETQCNLDCSSLISVDWVLDKDRVIRKGVAKGGKTSTSEHKCPTNSYACKIGVSYHIPNFLRATFPQLIVNHFT
jgi:hypothetical protein